MVTQDDLRELLAFEAGEDKVVSLYMNVDATQQTAETIKLQVRTLLKEADVAGEDAEAIEEYFDYAHEWSKPGIAIFSCASRDFFRSFPSAVAFRNRLRVGSRPHVKPLNHLLDYYAHFGVIVVDRVGARFFEYHLGELQRSDGVMGEDTRKLKRGGGSTRGAGLSAGSGQRGGTGARHEDEVAQRNLREAAAAAQQFFGQKPVRRLFIGGTDKTVAQFRDYLSKQMQSQLAGTFAIDMNAGEHEVRERSLELLQEANLDRERRLVETLITTAAKGGHAVVGLDDTLRTVSEGRVQTLVISDGFRAPGYWREAAQQLSAQPDNGDGQAEGQIRQLEDVVEAAVSRTMEQGGNVEIVGDNHDLERVGRIGALLRF